VNRQSRALLSVLLLGALVLTAFCIWRDLQPPVEQRATPAPETPVSGGTLTASILQEPPSFNRIAAAGVPTDLYALLTAGKLVRVNRATQEVEPSLAEKWEVTSDNRTSTLTLRGGVSWSDGTPFTSADVLFSFQAIYDKKVASQLAGSVSVNGAPLKVAAPDARTVVVTYPEPFGPGIRLLDNVFILPRHKLDAALEAGTFRQAWNPATPVADLVSIGPFQLARYEPGQRLVFDRNPHYWKKDAAGRPLPYLDHLVLEIVPEQNAELVRLQSGALDMLFQSVRPEDVGSLKPLAGQQRLQLIELGVGSDADALIFNLRPAKWATDRRGAWMARKEFRQAISYAVDREAFANTVYLGAAVPIWGPVTPGNKEWFSPNVPRYPFSLDKAKALLAGLGLENRDSDEWLEDPAGIEARFTLLTVAGRTNLERSASVLRDDLRQVGIAVDVQPLEQGAVIARMFKGDFEAIFLFFSASSLDPALNKDFWLSSGGAHVWNLGQRKPATEWEARIDALMQRQAATSDQAERKRLFDEVQNVFAENLPVLYFVAPRLYIGVSMRVAGLTPSILRPPLLWNAESIWVRSAGGSAAPASAPGPPPRVSQRGGVE
jgi:peptide/nickel transport system substrate-binding protein